MKNALRKELLLLRQELENKDELSLKISDSLVNFDCFLKAETILLYSSLKDEVSTEKIFKTCLEMKKTVAFPVCLDRDGTMEFFIVKSEAELERGMYNILSPKSDCKKLEPNGKCLCIVPGVAFDKRGYRLGYGKGYYDRFLDSFNAVSVGLCFDSLVRDTLPVNEYDKRVNYLITDKKIYNFNFREDSKNG